jgi:hypothetical protein
VLATLLSAGKGFSVCFMNSRRGALGGRPRARLYLACVWLLVFMIMACSGPGERIEPPTEVPGSGPFRSTLETAFRMRENGCDMEPPRQHAGEIMSFMLRVVVGKDGRPEMRRDWATRGLDFPLNLDAMSREMSAMGGGNILRIMVFDPNILDLSQTLYYYDDRLGFSKGRFNVYPATEFLAIRLLIIKKIARGEKINLRALLERRRLLFDKGRRVREEDLKATGLRDEEIELIRDILVRAPYLFEYLGCPFLVKGLYEAGVLSVDETVTQKLAEANYKDFPCRAERRPDKTETVRIAILPSLTKEFLFGTGGAALSPTGFAPSGYLQEMVEALKEQIIEGATAWIERKALEEGVETAGDPVLAPSWSGIVRSKVSFCVQDERPLVITPRNAAEVIEDICPEADFTVILLGKNVYLSLFIDPDKDTYPAVNRLYLDFDDIRYAQAKDRYEPIADVIYQALRKAASGAADSLKGFQAFSP